MRKLILTLSVIALNLIPLATSYAADSADLMRPCLFNDHVDCIEKITVDLPDGTTSTGFITGKNANVPIAPNDAYLSRISGIHDEWSFPGLKSQNGTDRVEFYIFHWPADAIHCDNASNCSASQEELGIYARPSMFDGGRPPVIVSGKDAELICPTGQSSCSIGSPPWNFESDITFHVQLRMGKSFFPLYANGRTKNFSLNVTPFTDRNIVDINFSPLILENVYFALADFFSIDHGLYVTNEPAMWIYTADNIRTDPLKPCVLSGGLSIVTNAFNQWSPTWNSANRSIDVQLRASHLRTDGSVNAGYLEIRIPTAMAKCLWGVNLRGEVEASVALTYTDGTPDEVLTVSSHEKDGYYSVISAGFHYSSPKLQIRLNGESDAAPPIGIANPNKPEKVSVTKTISCVKGKFVKKISGKNPKCPIGFKRVTKRT
ncbi:MAG: hypothetical protein ACKOVI_02645 [Candidatus Planktophila sp.]